MTTFLHLWVWVWFLTSPFVCLFAVVEAYDHNIGNDDTGAVVLAFLNLGMSGAFLCLLRKLDE